MDNLPDDILSEILFLINDPSTFISCLCVSRRWASILSSDSFWIRKCKFDKRVIPTKILKIVSRTGDQRTVDYNRIWLKNPCGRNLIRNPGAQAGKAHWGFSPADQWSFEKDRLATGAHETNFFIARQKDCLKAQTVDLWESGVDPWVLNELKPTIIVSEWHRTAVSSCDATANLHAILCNRDPVTKTLDIGRHTVACSNCVSYKWVKVVSKFVDYPDNMRYVHFMSSVENVKESKWCSRDVGVLMTNASVTLDFN